MHRPGVQYILLSSVSFGLVQGCDMIQPNTAHAILYTRYVSDVGLDLLCTFAG